jgi:hypothetical protein
MKSVCPFQVLYRLENLDNFNNHFTQRSKAEFSNFLVCGNLFQTEIFHAIPPLICIGIIHKAVVVVVVVVKIVDYNFLLVDEYNNSNLTVG